MIQLWKEKDLIGLNNDLGLRGEARIKMDDPDLRFSFDEERMPTGVSYPAHFEVVERRIGMTWVRVVKGKDRIE